MVHGCMGAVWLEVELQAQRGVREGGGTLGATRTWMLLCLYGTARAVSGSLCVNVCVQVLST